MVGGGCSENQPMKRTQLIISLFAMVVSLGAQAQTVSPYADQQQRAIKALSEQEISDLAEARGLGLAKAAELNSYPGPLHVLQLAKELELSDAQRTATEALYAEMRDKAQPVGRQIIEAESELDRAFVSGQIDTPRLRDRIRAIAILQGELRAIHLDAHLRQRPLLTAEQIARYNALRGYGGARPAHSSARHGG
jgi:Spy/CpxP family protein refolding chaperone